MSADALPQNDGRNFRAPQGEPTPGPEAGHQQPDLRLIEGELAKPPVDVEAVQKVGRFAAMANALENAARPVTPEAGNESAGRMRKMFERGAPTTQKLWDKLAARGESLKASWADARRLGRAVRQNGLQIAFGAAGMAKEATVNYVKETASYYGEAAKNAGRAAVDGVVAYGHDVAANYAEERATRSFQIENAAKALRNRSVRKAAKHEARLTERMTKVQELADAYADAKDNDKVVKMATTKLKGRWASYRANRSATKMSNKRSRAYSRNQRYETWADRTTRLAHSADAHEAKAAERRSK